MRVVIDTNILHQEGLSSISMHKLYNLVVSCGLQIYLPEIVEREYITSREIEIIAQLKNIKKSYKEINKMTPEFSSSKGNIKTELQNLDLKIKSAAGDVYVWFDRWTSDYRVKRLDIKPHYISSIFDDYFSGSGAFKQRKNRNDILDAIILENIKELSSQGESLTLLCGDKGLSQAASKLEGINIYSSLKEFLETKEVSDRLSKVSTDDNTKKYIDFFSSPEFELALRSFIHYLYDLGYLVTESVNNDLGAIPSGYSNVTVEPFGERLDELEVIDVVGLGSEIYKLSVEFEIDSVVTFAIPYEYTEDIESPYSIDSINGDGVCEVSMERKAIYPIVLTTNVGDGFIKNIKEDSQFLINRFSTTVEIENPFIQHALLS
ncbi:PIN domain-containing protein [Saccharospirillum alexandrii]|uniref:PIN domain-containing protein n=1 Tax=Saccharospirillum alexandrii TaxID=2448477 RepID=UPI0037354B10